MIGRGVVGFVSAALVLTAPAAGVEGRELIASLNDGSIAFISPAGVRTGTVAGPPVAGRSGPARPAWSPDGKLVAFAENGIVVADLAGRRRRLTTVPVERFDAEPAWSPDGAEIAFRRENADSQTVAVVPSTGGPLRVLASGGTYAEPRWQPGGRTLLFVRTDDEFGVYTVGAQGGPTRRIAAQANSAEWSPDGGAIALARREGGLEVIAPDGSDAHVLVPNDFVTDVAWSPDGRRIVFIVWTERRFEPKLGFVAQPDVFLVDRDGANLTRLTGLEGDMPFEHSDVARPAWWPGGSRLFFRRGKAVWTMNPDGSCERRFVSTLPILDVPTWSPLAAAVPTSDCAAAQIRLRAGGEEIGVRGSVPLSVRLRNDGTRSLARARLELTATRGVVQIADGAQTCSRGRAVVCSLGSMPPGAERALELVGVPAAAGVVKYTARILWDGPQDVTPAADVAAASAVVLPCDILGTAADDRLVGTAGRDRICGGPGADRIDGRRGRDTIDAGGGRDVVHARDGERDVVDCGSARDTVFADRFDVPKNCELVRR